MRKGDLSCSRVVSQTNVVLLYMFAFTGIALFHFCVKVHSQEPHLHPRAGGSSLHFICSSLKQGEDCILFNEENLKMECKKEAEIIVDTVFSFVRPWPERVWGPEDFDSICIIAPSRMLVSR